MQRCIDLARIAAGNVAPNPMVGAMLVYENRIIGEGYHQYYGGPHAEVNCMGSVKEPDRSLIPGAVLYVSLEPCAHFGKTPPCADLIIQSQIRKVVIGCLDPFVDVNGKGIGKLAAAGIETITGILEEECKELNKRFFTVHLEHRPYVILKWAQTRNGKIAGRQAAWEADDGTNNNRITHRSVPGKLPGRLFISNEYTNRLVHKWRCEESSILVGTNTALLDDPELTNRYWPGLSPIRLVVDMDLKLPSSLKMFNDKKTFTIVFNSKKHQLNISTLEKGGTGLGFYQVTGDVSLVHQLLNALHQLKVASVMVEGGAKLLQSFIDEGIWDEARVITNTELDVTTGLPAPVLSNHELLDEVKIMSDQIHYFAHIKSNKHNTA